MCVGLVRLLTYMGVFGAYFDVGFVGFGLASFLHWIVVYWLVGFLVLVFGLVVGFARGEVGVVCGGVGLRLLCLWVL